MRPILLLPNKYKKAGWVILIVGIILFVLLLLRRNEDFSQVIPAKILVLHLGDTIFTTHKGIGFAFEQKYLFNTLTGLLVIVGSMMVAFSKEKNEDEFIANLRLSSLLWAVFVNYLLIILAFILVYDIDFLYVIMYNLFTVLLIFIARFNYLLYRNAKDIRSEK